ncbi:hypothetical protein [Pseudomonas abieticivorans]|uniref:hypothetical protein n=1 Tax=Pseudomonas abieticivorans TaxID=2931382 RepID=UPI0020BEC860|nr:hypothetical protein [Pseudomonas sp. PIA16]
MKLYKSRRGSGVHLCHIAPVKGDGFTGLLHGLNLFVGGSHQNRKHGRRYWSGGMFISNSELLKEWAIDNTTSTNDILLKIEKFLGDIIPRYLELYPVTKSKKVSVINKILEVDKSASFDVLMMHQSQYLQERWASLSHTRYHAISPSPESKYITYIDSVSRFINDGGRRSKIFRSLRKLLIVGYTVLSKVTSSKTFNKNFEGEYGHMLPLGFRNARLKRESDWSKFKDFMYDTAFNTLQGRGLNINKFKSRLLSYLEFS